MRIISSAIVAFLIGATTASAQTSDPRPTLNVTTAYVGSDTDVANGFGLLYLIGTDVPLSERLSLRVEGGRRLDASRQWSGGNPYYFDDPADPSRTIEVFSHIQVSQSTVADLAAHLRYGTPAARRFQLGVLTGAGMRLLETRTTSYIPGGNPYRPEFAEHYEEQFHARLTLDAGIDAGVRVDDRWSLLAVAVASMPLQENLQTQARVGVMARWRF